jgi:hypothetical protein
LGGELSVVHGGGTVWLGSGHSVTVFGQCVGA